MMAGFMPLLCLSSQAAPPTAPDTAAFLKNILLIAEHNNLADVAYTQSIFGPNLTADSDGSKDWHPASGLKLNDNGAGAQPTGDMQYYYALMPMKSRLTFWKNSDDLFMAELGFENIPAFLCIGGKDIATVFHSDENVGLLDTHSHTFHVSQGPNMVTEIKVDGPVEGDEGGCVKGLTIMQHHMSEFVPSGGIGGGPSSQ
jgi:hypothetical protein